MASIHKRSPPGMIYNFTEFESMRDTSYRGTDLADAIPGGIDLSEWTITFDEPCEDLSRISNGAGSGPWFAPGVHPNNYSGSTIVEITDPTYTDVYTQRDTSVWGLHTKRFNGPLKWASIATASANSTSYASSSAKFGHAQQYGYWELTARLPNPSVNEDGTPLDGYCRLWPAFWQYSVNQFGSPYRNLGTGRIEPDIFEIYTPSLLASGERATIHSTMHYHESKLFNGPGELGYDGSDAGNTFDFRSAEAQAIWGTTGTFEFFDDFYTYGSLMTPEWWIIYFNRKEVWRFRMLTEFHYKYVTLISAQPQVLNIGGTSPLTFDYPFEVDNFTVWQNPEWHEVSGAFMDRKAAVAGGSANAYTWTTQAGSTGWVDGQTWVCRLPVAITGASTFNKDGAGAKSIVVGVVNPDNGYRTTPWLDPVTFRPTVAGDGDTTNFYAFKYVTALDAVLMLDEGRPQNDPGEWTGYAQPAASTINILTLEAALAAKAGIIDLMASGHPAHDLTIDSEAAGPALKPNVTIDTYEGAAPGTVIGTIRLANTPSQPAYFWMESSATYAINPVSGQIYVKTGASPTITTHELSVRAYCVPAVPTYLDANVCRLTINVAANTNFSPVTTFGSDLKVYFDFTDAANVTVNAGLVEAIDDLGPADNDGTQATAGGRPTYNTAGFNGRGAAYTTVASKRLTMDAYPLRSPQLGFNFLYSDGYPIVRPNESSSYNWQAVEPIDTSQAHIIFMKWSSDECRCWVNGEEIELESPDLYANQSGWMIAAVQCASSAASGSIFSANTSTAWFMNTSSSTFGLVGAVAMALIGVDPITDAQRQSLEGLLAHECWDTPGDVLPASHPWVSVYPKQFS